MDKFLFILIILIILSSSMIQTQCRHHERNIRHIRHQHHPPHRHHPDNWSGRRYNNSKNVDRCGVYGGDGSSCRQVRGVFGEDGKLKMGYNDIILIPRGAVGIKILEQQETNNYLAIRNMNGDFYLNGNWRIDYPRELNFAGTKFNYERIPPGSNGPEQLRAVGPTLEPIFISLLYQEANKGIEYSYMVPVDVRIPPPPPPPPAAAAAEMSYRWMTGDYGPCSAHCGLGGFQRRLVYCVNVVDGKRVDDYYCSEREPEKNRNCNRHPCPPEWVLGEWSSCQCPGVKYRTIYCQKPSEDHKSHVIAPEELCKKHASKPINLMECPISGCPEFNETDDIDGGGKKSALDTVCETIIRTNWIVGNWSKCDSRCGEGMKNRTVECLHEDGTPMEDSDCDMTIRPDDRMACDEKPCSGVDWITSPWSSCQMNCGSSIQTRQVQCSTKDGKVYSDETCTAARRPEYMKPCANYSGCDAIWFASQWSECSSTCGLGIKTRFVFCGMWDDDEIVTMKEDDCKNIPKPNDTMNCENDPCLAAGNWFIGPQEMCSTKCGEGTSPRILLCLDHQGSVDLSQCPDAEKPEEEVPCNQNMTCDDIDAGPVLIGNETDDGSVTEMMSCETSEFGCCPDWMTPRAKDFSNCPPPMDMEDKCDSSKFGCCQDGETGAYGPFQDGCTINCNDTRFGCCPDGVNTANSSNLEYCPPACLISEFGCCYDNETAATGKDGMGCPPQCMKSDFGCCPDNQTAAKGEDHQGCDDSLTGRTVPPPECLAIGEDEEGSGLGPICNETDIISDDLEGSCSNSTFGCCMDGITAAKGGNYTGCDDIGPTDCHSTKFGCCPDNESAAKGENGEGCRGHCSSWVHGCCPDNKTAAEGPGGVGCECESLPFGCCPDGRTPAKGERYYGCTCHEYPHGCCQDNYTPARGEGFDGCICSRMLYGCCPDNRRPATGPEMEGCDCRGSPYGCCMDGRTAAKGPRYEGCNCESMPFGCCSDQRTPASGHHYEGCPCSTRTYGCCPDNRTPARGPRYQGCECVNTPYGCCPDGSVAFGPNMQGCPEGPTLETKLAAQVCSLPKEEGPSRNWTIRWHFDIQSGTCNRFWYGGSQGNGNRFLSKEECEGACVSPKGTDVCLLPKVGGPCDKKYPAWYYNAENRECEQFIYSGCRGNKNRFNSKHECNSVCMKVEPGDRCQLSPDRGPCPGSYTKWFYNKKRGECQSFSYGGCKGNGNNFNSEKECLDTCGTLSPREICALPKAEGPCLGRYPRWFFNQAEEQCEEFMYTGCEGNRNRFIDKRKCEYLCRPSSPSPPSLPPPPSPTKDVCSQPMDPGTCSSSLKRYYYNKTYKRCEPFVYGGCEGNLNRFETAEECGRVCFMGFIPKKERKRAARILPGPQKVLAQYNYPTYLECNAVGYPRPQVSWWKNRTMLPHNSLRYKQFANHTLKIKRVGERDAGTYTCQADNGIGPAALWNVDLHVQFHPEPGLSSLPRRAPIHESREGRNPGNPYLSKPFHEPVTVSVKVGSGQFRKGSNLRIDCHVQGYPQPRVRWFYNNEFKALRSDGHRRILPNNTLLIWSLKEEDSGEYKCSASNEYNEAFASVSVDVPSSGSGSGCQDKEYFKQYCPQVIAQNYCANDYYAKVCCRSCLQARHPLPYSSNLIP